MRFKYILFLIIGLLVQNLFAQERTYVLSKEMFNEQGYLSLPDLKEWHFKKGNDSSWASPSLDVSDWEKLDSVSIENVVFDENRLFEGWFRIKIKLDSSFLDIPLFLGQYNSAATDVYIDGKLFHTFGNTDYAGGNFRSHNRNVDLPVIFSNAAEKEMVVAVHFVQKIGSFFNENDFFIFGQRSFLSIVDEIGINSISNRFISSESFFSRVISILGVLIFLFWLLFLLNKNQRHLLLIAISVTCIGGIPFLNYVRWMVLSSNSSNLSYVLNSVSSLSMSGVLVTLPMLVAYIFTNQVPKWLKIYVILVLIVGFLSSFRIDWIANLLPPIQIVSLGICLYYLISERKRLKGSKWIVVSGLVLTLLAVGVFTVLFNFIRVEGINEYRIFFLLAMFITFPISLVVYVAVWFKEMIVDVQYKANKVIQITEEKKELLANQNLVLEKQVKARTDELSKSLNNLKSTQSQLIQTEKMASLGELTAGIAHEIQNPLNFVNNFSEVSTELVDEMNEEIEEGNMVDVKEIAVDLKQNLEKINHHGKRAGEIVKGMLQHSRISSGKKEATDINALTDEYLRLAYHGLRAKDKSFNATFETDFDENIGKIDIIPQDVGRVILNLITNAFYAVNEKKNQAPENYEPMVKVSTKKLGKKIEISVSDNGSGMPEKVQEKIFQPFFTTKPTGQGTGLGLSLSYDIIKAHGGEINVESKEGEGTEFMISFAV